MDIKTVRNNLKQTIRGKEFLLNEYQNYGRFAEPCSIEEQTALAGCEMLRVNLAELKAILADVEQCCVKPKKKG